MAAGISDQQCLQRPLMVESSGEKKHISCSVLSDRV